MLTKHDKASKKARKILTKACAPSRPFTKYHYSYLEMSLEEINCVMHKQPKDESSSDSNYKS